MKAAAEASSGDAQTVRCLSGPVKGLTHVQADVESNFGSGVFCGSL